MTSTCQKLNGEPLTLPKLYKPIIVTYILGGSVYPSGGNSASANGTCSNDGINRHSSNDSIKVTVAALWEPSRHHHQQHLPDT